jgi:hypothetical protein
MFFTLDYKAHINKLRLTNKRIKELRATYQKYQDSMDGRFPRSRFSIHFFRHLLASLFAGRNGDVRRFRDHRDSVTKIESPESPRYLFTVEFFDYIEGLVQAKLMPNVRRVMSASGRAVNIFRVENKNLLLTQPRNIFPASIIDFTKVQENVARVMGDEPVFKNEEPVGVGGITGGVVSLFEGHSAEITNINYNVTFFGPDKAHARYRQGIFEFDSAMQGRHRALQIRLSPIPAGLRIRIKYLKEENGGHPSVIHTTDPIASREFSGAGYSLPLMTGTTGIELFLEEDGTAVDFSSEVEGQVRFINNSPLQAVAVWPEETDEHSLPVNLVRNNILEAEISDDKKNENKLKVIVPVQPGNYVRIKLFIKEGSETKIICTDRLKARSDERHYILPMYPDADRVQVSYEDKFGNPIPFENLTRDNARIVAGDFKVPYKMRTRILSPVTVLRKNRLETSIDDELKSSSDHLLLRVAAPQGLFVLLQYKNQDGEVVGVTQMIPTKTVNQGYSIPLMDNAETLVAYLFDARGQPVEFPLGEGFVTYGRGFPNPITLYEPSDTAKLRLTAPVSPPRKSAKRGFSYAREDNRWTQIRQAPRPPTRTAKGRVSHVYLGEENFYKNSRWLKDVKKWEEEQLGYIESVHRKTVRLAKPIQKERIYRVNLSTELDLNSKRELRFIFVKNGSNGEIEYEVKIMDFSKAFDLIIPAGTQAIIMDLMPSEKISGGLIEDAKLRLIKKPTTIRKQSNKNKKSVLISVQQFQSEVLEGNQNSLSQLEAPGEPASPNEVDEPRFSDASKNEIPVRLEETAEFDSSVAENSPPPAQAGPAILPSRIQTNPPSRVFHRIRTIVIVGATATLSFMTAFQIPWSSIANNLFAPQNPTEQALSEFNVLFPRTGNSQSDDLLLRIYKIKNLLNVSPDQVFSNEDFPT